MKHTPLLNKVFIFVLYVDFEFSTKPLVPHSLVCVFVSDLRQVGGFLRKLRFPPPIKLTSTI